MDNLAGATPVRFIMAQIPSSRVPSSEQYVQLPSMQQLVSPNAKHTLIQPMMSPPQAESQTVVQLPSMQQLISQTAKPVQLQQMVSPSGESQTVVHQTGAVGGQPVFPGQMGMPSVLNPGGIYASNYQLVPRHYALVNQGLQSTSLAVQMSPQGAATLSPGEQFIQPTVFDQQLANFSNPNNQFTFQNQSPQMLQSPGQQFGIQTQNLGHINPGIITGGQGQNIFIPGQGMIVQGQTMLPQNSSTIFSQNPNLNPHQLPISQNTNIQTFANNGSIMGHVTGLGTQIFPGPISVDSNHTSPMASPNSTTNLLSPSSAKSADISPSTGRKRKPSGQKSKPKQQQESIIQLNSQLQFLSHLAGQSQMQQNLLSQNANAVNLGNLSQSQLLPNLVTQNQTLPSFGHFLLHQQQQQQQQHIIPNPNTLDIHQAAVNVMGGPQTIGAGATLSPGSLTNLVSGQNIPNIFGGQSFPYNIAGASNITNNSVMQLQSGGVNLDFQSQVSGANVNIDVNNWNTGHLPNYTTTLLHGHGGSVPLIPGGVPRLQQTGLVQPTVSQARAVQPKCVTCVSKTTDTISTSNIVKTKVVHSIQDPKLTSVTTVTFGVTTIPTSKVLSPKKENSSVSKTDMDFKSKAEVACKSESIESEVKPDIPICKNVTCPKSVVVPFGWLRLQEGQSIVYYSPSFARLTSYENIKQYLLMEGTCKCGLECPLLVEKVFNFDLNVGGIQWSLGQTKVEDIGKLCNHRRKIIAMASFQQTRALSTVQDSVTVKNVIMSPRVTSTVQEKTPRETKKKLGETQQQSEKPATSVHNNEGFQLSKLDEKVMTNTDLVVEKARKTKVCATKVKENSDGKIDSGVKAMDMPNSEHMKSELTKKAKEMCDVCRRNKHDCDCGNKNEKGTGDLSSSNIPQEKTCNTNVTSITPSKQTSDDDHDIKVMSESNDLRGSDIIAGNGKVSKTNSKSVPKDSSGNKTDSPGLSHMDTTNTNNSKLSTNVTLSSIKKLVSQVSEKIAAENLSSAQKAKLCDNNVGHIVSCVRPNLHPCQNGSLVNNSEYVPDKRVLLNSSDRLSSMRESANFNQLLLSNMLKLTSPPNQQVFPNHHSLPSVQVQGMVRGYQHGALPNTRPVFNQVPLSNIPRFTAPGTESGQTLGSLICNYGGPSIPDCTHYPWMNRKSKSKKTKSKVDSQISNLFESESPPPNVDVSKLKDKGHGHIPKQKIASFMENPSEFMEHQTALVNHSISSTSPSPKRQNEVEPETCESIKRSESVDSDRLSVGKRSDSVNSDRIASPDKNNETCMTIDIKDTENINEHVAKTGTDASATVISKATIVPTNADSSLGAPKEEDGTASDAVQHKTPASAPHTPSAVVHHPPEVSQTSNSQSPLTDEKTKSESLQRQSNQPSLSAILNQQCTSQAFQQMFPNVVQEAFLQNLGFINGSQQQGSLQTPFPLVQVCDALPVSKPLPTNSSSNSLRPLCNLRNFMGRQLQQTPIRQILENQNTNEFPASNLLSAAARAQLLQQQSHLNLMLAQQMNGEIINPFYNSQTNNSVPGVHTGTLGVTTCNPLSSQLPVGASYVGNSENMDSIKAQVKPHSVPSGTSKISELLNQSNSIIRKAQDVTGGEKLSTTEVVVTTLQQPHNNKVHNMVTCVSSQPTHTPNSLNQNVSNVNINQQLLNYQQLMQICNAMGLPFMPSWSFDAGHPILGGVQGLPMANSQLLPSQPATATDKLNLNQSPNGPVQSDNSTIQQVAVTSNVKGSPDKTHLAGTVQGNCAQFQGSVAQTSNVLIPNSIPEANILGMGFNPNGNSAVLQGLNQAQSDLNVHINRPEQHVCSSAEASLVVMQNGIPMIQMVAPNHISVGSNVDRSNLPQLTLSNQGVGIQNLMQNGIHCPISACRPVVPLNLINVQQSWNNGNTNLTAMQLQTLQLQQQLLHQIQQVQGMQSLINQFSIQGLSNSTNFTPASASAQGSSSALNNSSTTTLTPSSVVQRPDRRQACANTAEENLDSVSSCVITSTVKSSRPDSVSTTCSLQSENHDTVTPNKVSVTAADTTQESPVQCKSVTTRTVDIGTETEAFEDDEEEDVDEDSENDDESTNESTEDAVDTSEKVEAKHEDHSESELEGHHETVNPESKPVSNVPSATKKSSVKSCYSLALESVTAQRNRVREAESVRSSRKRYYSSTGDFTTVKSESTDKRLKLVIRKRTGLSPIKGNDEPRKKKFQFQKESVSSTQSSENLFTKAEMVEKSIDSDKRVRLKIHRKKSVCETITSLYSSTEPNTVDKKQPGKLSLTKVKSDSCLVKTVQENLDSKLMSCETDSTVKTVGDGSCKFKDENDKNKTLDCDSSSLEEPADHTYKTVYSAAKPMDESEPTTTMSDVEYVPEKERKQNELTSRIAAALTTQKGRWHLSASPKKDNAITDTHEMDGKGLKRLGSFHEFEVCEDTQDSSNVTTTSQAQSFHTGDLVWGQIRGFPSWPGKLVDAEYKVGEIEDGKLLVRWFGDHTLTQVEPGKLKTLSEGLEAHHRARKKHRKGRKMNTNLEQAIQEAMAELDRQTAETDDTLADKEKHKLDKKKAGK